jgi:hypothetical protein
MRAQLLRILLVLTVCLIASAELLAGDDEEQQYELVEKYTQGETFCAARQLETQMSLTIEGENRDGRLPVKYKGMQEYVQKVLAVDEDGKPVRVARRYEKDEVETEQPGGEQRDSSTPFEGNTYIIEKKDESASVQLVGGEEVTGAGRKELAVAVQGSQHRVLPEAPVKVGDKWDVPLEAIREIYSIDSDITGSAEATFVEKETVDKEDYAVIKIAVQIETVQNVLTLTYTGEGRARFAIGRKRLVSLNFSADIEVKGAGQTPAGEVKLGGTGKVNSRFKVLPGEAELELPESPDEKKTRPEKSDDK